MSGARIRGLTIWHCVELFLFVVASISFWAPHTTSRVFKASTAGAPTGFLIWVLVVMILAAITEFFLNFGIAVDHISSFNSIDNFYDPAPCSERRQLKSGILLRADAGKMYQMMWVSNYVTISEFRYRIYETVN